MATESPIRILEASGKWPSGREAVTLGQSSVSVSSEELRLLLSVNGRNAVPNRSESAPPSIEGSVAALQDFVSQQDSSGYANLASINSAIGNYQSEEQLRTDPAYVAYYCSNVNLNPRLPPPLISWETSRLVHRVGSRNNSWRLASFSDSSNDSLHLSQRNLPTHDEESEDDKSSQMPPDDWKDGNNEFGPGQERTSSGQHQNLVNLIQDDLSPRSSPSIKDESIVEAVDLNSGSSSLCDTSVSIANAITSPEDVEYIGCSSNTHPTATIERSTSVDSSAGTVAKSPVFSRKSNRIDVHLENAAITGGHTEADVVYVESQMKAVYVTRLPNPDTHKNQKYRQNNRQNNSLQQPVYQQENESHIHLSKPQLISQGVNHTYTSVNQFLHGPSSFSAGEFQPILQPSGFTTPLHAAAAAYMASPNLFYPNLPLSGYIPPHYGVGGYSLNSAAIPTFVGGYPPHSAIPLAFDGAAGPSLSSCTFGVSNGGSLAHGQFGFTMQTSLADPFHMQYSQQVTTDACNVSGHFYPVVSRTGVVANQARIPNSKKGGVFSSDQQPPQQETVGSSNLTSRSDGTLSSQYIGSAINMGMLIQFPTSPIGNPVLCGSPVDGLGFLGGRNEVSFPPCSSRNNGVYPGWQGESKPENVSGSRVYSFLEELKSGKGRRFELSDIAGHIVEFSTDQHGSRFIQQKLESCNVEEKASVFKEVIPYAAKLMTDVFGNYVIQKFFEYGSADQRKFLANQLEGRILPLSLQMYGCRVIQKALDVIELDQKIGLVLELDGHIIRCVRDQNGNHVMQKCIESIPADKIRFIISAFRGQVATLSTHPYGCRVIQRVLERCTDELQSQFIVDEILESICALSQDQYGNYVTQHVLERGKPRERSQIIRKLSGHIVQMSQHKFASNVVEKCLQHGDSATWEVLIGEILGQHDGNDNLLAMMKDQYANYVVQKILETCTADQREMLLRRISAHLNALKKYTYGKHIVARFEQLYGEEIQKSESCCC